MMIRKIGTAAGLLFSALFSHAAAAAFQLNLTTGATKLSQEVYDLHNLMMWIILVIFVAVFAVMFWLASRSTLLLAPVDVVTPVPPYAVAIVEACHAAEAIVPRADTLPLASRLTDFSAGYVTKTFTAPGNVTALPELLEARIVVRVSVGPVVEYVPMPTSQLPSVSVAP